MFDNHRRVVAQSCVNGDWLSQWRMAKFDPAQIRNPSTDRPKTLKSNSHHFVQCKTIDKYKLSLRNTARDAKSLVVAFISATKIY